MCVTTDPSRHHPPENAIDGTEQWWQSPPLSRGMRYNEVNLTIDLGQVSRGGQWVPGQEILWVNISYASQLQLHQRDWKGMEHVA